MMQIEKVPSAFITMKNAFAEEFSRSLESGSIDNLRLKWASFDAKDNERRAAMEEAVRTKLINLMIVNGDGEPSLGQEIIPYLLDTVMSLCRRELVSPVLSVCLLSDLLDTSTISRCEKIFDFVERHVATWKEPIFFSACKNQILRMCNDLLRRLSKTQHNSFSGRILLFLAMFFPFSERSGLNIVSEFNIDNYMKYGTEDLKDEHDESLETIDANIKLDSTFYTKFWSLQEYFRSPNLCYSKAQWKEFVSNANTVLSVFKNFKLSTPDTQEWSNEQDDEEFITKFLTNQKLLLHQLEDAHFRRTIYIQFLILFQFLTAQVKTKQESNELKPEQIEWIKSSTEKVHKLIKESPPNGDQFLTNILQLLKRDEHWSRWKNEGCPALKKIMLHYDKPSFQNKPPTTNTCDWTNLGTILCRVKSTDKIIMPRIDGPEVVDMKHDYLAFCKGRSTVPELNVFLKDAIQQSESQEYIDPSNKKVADKQFSWVALKLLSQKSPHFFSLHHPPISKLPDFVDHICRKIYREQNPGLLLPPLMPAPKTGSGGSNKTDSAMKRTLNARGGSGGLSNSTKDKTSNATDQKVKSSSANTAAPPAKIAKTISSDKQVKSSTVDSKPSNTTSSGTSKSVDKTEKISTSQSTQKSKDKVEKKEKTPEKAKSATQGMQQSKSKDKTQEKSKTEKVVKTHDKERTKKDKSPIKRKRTDDRESDEKRVPLSYCKKSKDKKEDTVMDDESPVLKPEQISKLAKLISGSWKKVADKLGYKSDEIEYIESHQDTDYSRALNLLLIWTNNEDDATADSLRRCLKDLGLVDAANILPV